MYHMQYNPITRNHEVQNEDGQAVESFPAGDTGRQAAKERTIQLNDPALYRLAWYYAYDLFRNRKQELFNRVWSAAELVINGQAQYRYGADPGILIARVKSQTVTRWDELAQAERPIEYGITRDIAGRYRCQCFDYHNTAPKVEGQPLCKHVIAAKLLINRHPQKYSHMHGISQDMAAALLAGYHHGPAPEPAQGNAELTAALQNARKVQAQHMTDLAPAEIDQLLHGETTVPPATDPVKVDPVAEANALFFD